MFKYELSVSSKRHYSVAMSSFNYAEFGPGIPQR